MATNLTQDANGNLLDANGNIVSGSQTPGAAAGGAFSGLASLVGGQLLGPSITNPNFQNAVGTLQSAQQQIQATATPSAQQLQLIVQNYVDQGILTPAQAQAVQQNPNALQTIMTNPALTNDQMSALSSLQQIANGSGITPQMAAQLNQITEKNAADARGQNAATMQQAQERGMGNSGTTLLGNLTNNQSEAANNYNEGLGVAAQGQTNALNALTSGANLAGNMQAQSFGQQAQVDAATNAINNFNANNAQNVNLTNTNSQNQAMAANLANKQNTANASTTAQNQAAAVNSQIPQTIFNDQNTLNNSNLNAAKDVSGAQTALGTAQTTAAGNATNSLATAFGNPNVNGSLSNSIGSGLFGGSSGSSAASDASDVGDIADDSSDFADFFSDKNLKTNVKNDDFDMDKFLDNLSGYKYQYKPKAVEMGMPTGEQHGPMAQDLEKSPVGKSLVEDTPDGKMVDYSKSGPVMMAALANLHGRMRKVEGAK